MSILQNTQGSYPVVPTHVLGNTFAAVAYIPVAPQHWLLATRCPHPAPRLPPSVPASRHRDLQKMDPAFLAYLPQIQFYDIAHSTTGN